MSLFALPGTRRLCKATLYAGIHALPISALRTYANLQPLYNKRGGLEIVLHAGRLEFAAESKASSD